MFMYTPAPGFAKGLWKVEIEASHSNFCTQAKLLSFKAPSSQLRIIIIFTVNLGNTTSIVVT